MREKNHEQDIKITKLETKMKDFKDAIEEFKLEVKEDFKILKEQSFNHLPSQIQDVKDKVLWTLVGGIILIIITQLLTRFL